MHTLIDQLPQDWQRLLMDETKKDYWDSLEEFVLELPEEPPTFPPRELIFNAFHQTRYHDVKVVILGQDPYHNEGQAHGLSFSVPRGVSLPPSLRNIYRELEDDLGASPGLDGDLHHWAKQGVLLLNTVLTVEAHQPHSHRKKGWEDFTDAVIQKLVERESPIAFVLWGKPAQKKKDLILIPPHCIIESAHPSPLSARRGFFGSRPFSKINDWLNEQSQSPIQW
ncbi:MAG: uracil-DNA glycosylase [Pirellulaceae bacterium]|mgnify:FL=1|nr:uracil-DNA glycosylase [Pirellulaceae bacterium]